MWVKFYVEGNPRQVRRVGRDRRFLLSRRYFFEGFLYNVEGLGFEGTGRCLCVHLA